MLTHLQVPLFTVMPALKSVIGGVAEAGWLGVEVFFVLSGFIIAYTYADKFHTFTWAAYRKYLTLRLARIYPIHLVTFLTMAVVVAGAFAMGISLEASERYSPSGFIDNLVLIQAVPPFWAWNGPAWSISTEFAAYLVFPVLALMVTRLTNWKSAVFAAAGNLTAAAVVMGLYALHIDANEAAYAMIWMRIGFEFTAGTLLFAVWRNLGRFQFGAAWDWIAALATVGTLVMASLLGQYGAVAIVTLPVTALLVLSLAGSTGFIAHALSSRITVWGGRISYSVYMVHMIILMVAGVLIPWDSLPTLAGVGALAGVVALIIVAGALLYHFVEEPGRAFLRRMVDQRPAVQR